MSIAIGTRAGGKGSGRSRAAAVLFAAGVSLGLMPGVGYAQEAGQGTARAVVDLCESRPQACPAPDLVLSNVGLPDPAVAGQPVTLTFAVSNPRPSNNDARGLAALIPAGTRLTQSQVPAGMRYTAFSAPRGYSCTAPAPSVSTVVCAADRPDAIRIDVSLSFALTFAHNPVIDVARTLTARVTVDPDNAVAERDEGNNAAARSVAVKAPDLRVSILEPPSRLPYNAKYEHPIWIRNTGDAPATFAPGAVVLTGRLLGYFIDSMTVPTGMECSKTNSVHQRPFWDRNRNPMTYDVAYGTLTCKAAGTFSIQPGQRLSLALSTRVQGVPGHGFPEGAFTATVFVDPGRLVPEFSNSETLFVGRCCGENLGDNAVTDGGGLVDFG